MDFKLNADCGDKLEEPDCKQQDYDVLPVKDQPTLVKRIPNIIDWPTECGGIQVDTAQPDGDYFTELNNRRSDESQSREESENKIHFDTVSEHNDQTDQPQLDELQIEHVNELKNLICDFQMLCNTQLDRISQFATTFNNGSGDRTRQRTQIMKLKKKKYKKRPNIFKNLIIICMMIILLMQIHMYILLYSKFNRMHMEIKELSCVIYGKNCPNAQTAYQCLTNRIDFMDTEHSRSLQILHHDMEEMVTVMNNVSQIVYTVNEATDGKNEVPYLDPI